MISQISRLYALLARSLALLQLASERASERQNKMSKLISSRLVEARARAGALSYLCARVVVVCELCLFCA